MQKNNAVQDKNDGNREYDDAVEQWHKSEVDIDNFRADLTVQVTKLESSVSSYDSAIEAYQSCIDS
jgi:hypothetical protein